MKITRLKIPTTNLTIYKCGRGVQQLQIMTRVGHEPVTPGVQVWFPNHSPTLPPSIDRTHRTCISVLLFQNTAN